MRRRSRRRRNGGSQNRLRGHDEEGCSTARGKANVRLHDLHAVMVPMRLEPRRVLRMIRHTVVVRRKPRSQKAEERSRQKGGSTQKRVSAAHAA